MDKEKPPINLKLDENVYKRFHKKAIKHCGDNRYADCDYLRFLVSDAIDHTKRTYREKALAMVNIQEMLNKFISSETDSERLNELNLLKKETLKLWDI